MGQHDHFCFFTDVLFQQLRFQLIAGFRTQRNRNDASAHNFNVQCVVGIAGRGNQNFVAVLDKRQDREVQTAVRAGRDQDVALGIDMQVILCFQLSAIFAFSSEDPIGAV